MPIVPIEKNRVGIAEVSGAKLQAADTSGTGLQAIGAGLQQAGQAGEQFAKTESDLHILMDETSVKALDLQATHGLNSILRDGDDAYFNQQGFNAVAARPDADKRITQLRGDLLSAAKTPRQRQMFANVFDQRAEAERASMLQFASKQVLVEAQAQSMARRDSYAQDARRFGDDPERRDMAVNTGLGEIETQGHHEGWSTARMAGEKTAYTSSVYGGIVEDKMINDPRDAEAFLDAHASAITPEREGILRRALHGPLREQQAFEDVHGMLGGASAPSAPGEFDARDPAPLSSTSSVARKIIGAESGGNANARNPVSSASGLGQFTRKTFVDLYTQTYGAGEQTPDQIWQMRSDPTLGRKMTEALVTRNASMLKNAGAPVNDTALYLAHFLGPRAANVLKADPNAPITSLVPAEFVRANPSVLGGGKTAGDVVEWADRKMGGGGVRPTYVPRREDLNSLYQRVDAQPGWSFDRKQAARDELDRQVSRQDHLVSRQEDDAERAALDTVTRLGPRFQSMTQLGALAERVSPQARARLTAQAAQNAAPKPIEANSDAIITLHQLAESDPDAFNKIDLRGYRSAVTPAEFDQIATLQARMLAKPNSDAQVAHDRIWKFANFYGRDIGIDMAAQRKGESDEAFQARRKDGMGLFNVMQNTLGAITDGKRQPTDDEIKKAFDNAIMPIAKTKAGWFADTTTSVPRFRDPTLPTNSVAIPAALHDRIRANLKALHEPYDDQSVARFYLRTKR